MEEVAWSFNRRRKRKALSEIAKVESTKRPEHQKLIL